MKYNWEELTEKQKMKAIEWELKLATHNGTTKQDMLNMLAWLYWWGKEELKSNENN